MTKKKAAEKKPRQWSAYPPICLYGFAGSGKTGVCLKAAEYVGWERTLWLHTERKTAQYTMPEYTESSPFGVINVQHTPVEEIYDFLEDIEKRAAAGERPYDLVVLDSISELEFVNIDSIEKSLKKDSKSGKKADGRQVWGEEKSDMLNLFWRLTNLNSFVLLTAHVTEVPNPVAPVNEDGSKNFILRPHMSGYWAKGLDHRLDMTLYMERKSMGERRIYLKPTGTIHVLDRFEHLVETPQYIVVPDFADDENVFATLLAYANVREV